MSLPPARVASPIADVETPALVIDLDAYERNLGRMVDSLEGHPVRLRAHAKTHKCPIIANHQVSRGAVGICCQTLGEAEAMVFGGVRNILITNQIVSAGKLRRLAALAKQAEVMVCADDEANLHDLDAAAEVCGVRLPVLVEVNIGQNRCGVEPGAPTLALAQSIASCRNLHFAGIQAYHGKAQHIYDPAERTKVVDGAVSLVRQTVDLLRSHGLECERVSGGGTGTYPIEAASGVYNEVQSGSYIFMDADYRRVRGDGPAFENALFVLTTVISRSGGRAVCDAGLKASSLDSGMPVVRDRPGIQYLGAADEHGMLHRDGDPGPLHVGDQLWLIPGHCDPTVNLYDWYVCIRGDIVEALWPISARARIPNAADGRNQEGISNSRFQISEALHLESGIRNSGVPLVAAAGRVRIAGSPDRSRFGGQEDVTRMGTVRVPTIGLREQSMKPGDLELFSTEELIDELLRRTTFQGVIVHARDGAKDRHWNGERIFRVRLNANLGPEEAGRLLDVVSQHIGKGEEKW